MKMEFHEKDGGLYMPKNVNGRTVLVCRICGHKMSGKVKKSDFEIKGTIAKPKEGPAAEIVVVEQKKHFEALPRTQVLCPNCENKEAFWWMQQTRSADEPPTRFMRCCKCGHVWREYE
jgi:DNA-directed RNA polymerase subunit M